MGRVTIVLLLALVSATAADSSDKSAVEMKKPQSEQNHKAMSSVGEMVTAKKTTTAIEDSKKPTALPVQDANTSPSAKDPTKAVPIEAMNAKSSEETLKTDSSIGLGFYSGVMPFGYAGYSPYPYYRSYYPYDRPYLGRFSYPIVDYPWYHRHYNPSYRYIRY